MMVADKRISVPVEWSRYLQCGHYFHALADAYNRFNPTDLLSYDPLAYALEAVGRFKEAEKLAKRKKRLQISIPNFEQAAGSAYAPAITPDRALATLIRAVRHHKIVIVGEQHHSPEHRLFGASILGELRKAGITHFAIETSDQGPLDYASITRRIAPSSDWSAFEPQRAGLLRAAVAVQLPMIAFDVGVRDIAWMSRHPEKAFAYREMKMARYVYERALKKMRAEKILVWVGYDHSLKQGKTKFMARYLWDMVREEPYVAYQTTGVLEKAGVDVLIRHPKPRYIHGRPDWLRAKWLRGYKRVPVKVAVDVIGTLLVQAQSRKEGPRSTPVDQIMTHGRNQVELLLPAGEYTMRILASDEQVLRRWVVSI